MAAVGKPSFEQRLARAGKNVAAVSGLLEQVARMLRQLVHVAGWLVLLYWIGRLPFRPDLSVAHLVLTPGGGLLAVIQGIVKRPRWLERANAVADALESEPAVSGELADMGRLTGDADASRLRGTRTRYRLACGNVRVVRVPPAPPPAQADKRWKVIKTGPGETVWIGPAGRRRTVEPTRYLIV